MRDDPHHHHGIPSAQLARLSLSAADPAPDLHAPNFPHPNPASLSHPAPTSVPAASFAHNHHLHPDLAYLHYTHPSMPTLPSTTPNPPATHPHPSTLPTSADEEPSRMGFVVGAPAYPHPASWPAPAVDAVYNLAPAPHAAAMLAPPSPNHRPIRNDPWAQSAVWRPSPLPDRRPFAPPFTRPVPPLPAPVSDNNHHPILPKSHRRRRRNPATSDLSTDPSPACGARVNADGAASADVTKSTSAVEPPAEPNRPAAIPVLPDCRRHVTAYTRHSRPSPSAPVSSRPSAHGSNGHLSVREYNRRISAYARRRDLNGALRTLGELDRAPKVSRNLFTYNAVINALVMCSQHARADEFWREMQETGIEPNLVTFNTMLKSCFGGMDEDVQRAFRLLKEMEDRGITADRVTLNSLINACVSAGRVRDAQGVYEQMRRLNIEPDAYTFCTLAKQARHQCDVSMLDALLLHQLHHHTILQQRMQTSSSSTKDSVDVAMQISPVAYNTIADAYIRCGYPTRAISLLERMRGSKRNSTDVSTSLSPSKDVIPVSPDVQTFNVRLKALRESGAPATEAFTALEEMRSLGLEADHITLLTLADLCCRREEMALAEGVLHAATEADIKEFENGSVEWKSLCTSKQGPRQAQEATSGPAGNTTLGSTGTKRNSGAGNLSQTHNGVNRRNANQPRNAKANAALFNALIRGYSSLDPPNVDAAVALYLEMRRYVETYGFSWYAADSVTYTMLVDGFARVGDAGRAELIISEMEAAGRSNVVAYNAYLKANRGNGFKAALSILERMKNVGLRPDVVTYNTIIDFLSSEDNGTQIAEELVRVDMPRNGVRPDLLTFNTLIKGVARNRGNKSDAGTALGAAYRWLRELQSRGLKPDEFTYQSMVSACAAAGDAPRALDFFRKVEAERAKRVKANGRTNGVTSNHSSQGLQNVVRNHANPVNGASLSSSAMSAGSPPTFPVTSRGMGRHRSGQEHLAFQTQQTSNDWMLLPHPAAYIALMRAFLSSNAKDGVESVLLLRDEMVARGLELGRTGYTAVADAHAERGDFESVEATLREMSMRDGHAQEQKLSAVHHCIRMKALCNAGRLDDAIAILPDVENADTAVFNVLIFACAKNKDMDRMITVLRSMESCQVEPDAITSRALSSMMRNVARTLKSFDERFCANITAFLQRNQGRNDVIVGRNGIDLKSSLAWEEAQGTAPSFGTTPDA